MIRAISCWVGHPGTRRTLVQHMAHPSAFLPREARVRRHSAAVERCKKAVNGLLPDQILPDRSNHGTKGPLNRRRMAGGQDELEVLILFSS